MQPKETQEKTELEFERKLQTIMPWSKGYKWTEPQKYAHSNTIFRSEK